MLRWGARRKEDRFGSMEAVDGPRALRARHVSREGEARRCRQEDRLLPGVRAVRSGTRQFGRGTHGVARTEEGPSLQERLGGWPFRAYGDVPREPEPLAMGESPREAGVLPGPPRRAAGPRDAGAQGLYLIAAFLRDTSAAAGRGEGAPALPLSTPIRGRAHS